jgi:kynureninase
MEPVNSMTTVRPSGPSSQPLSRRDLGARDAADPLAPFRARFALPEGVIYLDGNSLGALPRETAGRVAAVVEEEWGRSLIRAWNRHGWIEAPRRIGNKIARLIGAGPGEVIVADSTSVNVFKALAAALELRPGRRTILTQTGNFPTDRYVADGLARLLGGGRRVRAVPADEIAGALDDDTAVLMLTHVDYRSGAMHDMAELTAAAHETGALVLWDLAHSAGALPVDLTAAGADLAVGCGYKYLNGGPGAPAFLYVARRHQDAINPPLAGWLGHARPFEFSDIYAPADGIQRHLGGTPVMLGMAALEVGVDMMLEVDMAALRAKSVALCEAFMALVETRCAGHGLTLASPRDAARRGSQICFAHPEGYPIMQALIAQGVIGDFRAPDILRFGFTPLYLRHVDVWDAVEILREILETRAWDRAEYRARAAVT